MKNPKYFPIPDWLLDTYLRNSGATYPGKTLERRLNLLTTREIRRVKSLYKKLVQLEYEMDNLTLEVDDILSIRADKAKDKWP